MKRVYNIILFLAIAILASSCAKEKETVMLTGLEISPNTLTIPNGESRPLEVIFTPASIEDKSVEFSTSREDIISVDENGVVSAHGIGRAVVTVISQGLMAVCDVTVTASAAEGIALDKEELRIAKGDLYKLSVILSPEDSDISSLQWNSSDESVAVVDQEGVVLAKKDGEAVITATLGELSATCDVTVFSMAKAGDFFYSDGTWSSELDPSKEVVGVVFYAGDPSVDDEILRNEHPECVNGLAVSLDQSLVKYMSDQYYNWQQKSGYKKISDWVEDNTDYETLLTGLARGDVGNMMLGYNNTKAMQEFNDAYPDYPLIPISDLATYREENPLPESTSGWYMPSLKELYVMCEGPTNDNVFWRDRFYENMEVMNASLSKVEGAQVLDTTPEGIYGTKGRHWSSTEYYTEGSMVFMHFSANQVPGGQYVSSSEGIVRYVFAF